MNNLVQPNFLIIGAMKASTTLLYEMLGQHPQFWFSPEKEPGYFTRNDYGSPESYKQYLSLFSGCPPGKSFVGEASTSYTKAPHIGPTAKRIRETLGQPKLIYILRDPVERTISHFKHAYIRGAYPTGFPISRALTEDPIIVCSSLYAYQIAQYEAEFGPRSLLVLVAEELHRNPIDVLREVERFLGASRFDDWKIPARAVNSTLDVQKSAMVDRLIGGSVSLRRFASCAPDWLKAAMRHAASRAPQPTTVTLDDKQKVFERVADDLIRLQDYMGDKIARWPSVRMLSATRLPQHCPELSIGAVL